MTIWKTGQIALAELGFTRLLTTSVISFFLFFTGTHLDDERAKDNGAEDQVVEDAVKDVSLAVDFAGIDLVEELHQHKGVEDNGVVFRGR